MPRTAKTDPLDSPCWVEGCNNVAGKHRLCEPHKRQLAPSMGYMHHAIEAMEANHRLREKHTREILTAARKAGLKVVKKPSYAELDRQ